MNKQDLATAIEAYAAAKSTGNPTLIQFAGTALQEMLARLPDGDLTNPLNLNLPAPNHDIPHSGLP